MVEHLIRNEGVDGSSPSFGSAASSLLAAGLWGFGV
jgi:hypothetical protein